MSEQSQWRERPAFQLAQVCQVERVRRSACVLRALVAGGDARDDERTHFVGVFAARDDEVRSIVRGQLEGDTWVDDPVRGNNRKLGCSLCVELREWDEIAQGAAHCPMARCAHVVASEHAVPILVDQGVSLDR